MDQWEDLKRRVAALEAAAAPAPQPEPPDDRLTFLANWIVGFVGSALTRDHAESLARALLTRPETRRVLAGTRVAASSESTLAAIIREVDGSHRMGAAALAEAILRHSAAADVFATSPPQPPMAWPELPEEVPECLLPDDQSSILRPFALLVWRYTCDTLAEMNPNRRQEGVSRG